MIFYLHLSIFSLTLYLLPVGQKLVMIICLLKLNGASVFIFLWFRKYSYWQKVRGEIDILINSEYIRIRLVIQQTWDVEKKYAEFHSENAYERDRENIGKERKTIGGERKRIWGEIGVLFFNEKD